jgi:hypothetical protein
MASLRVYHEVGHCRLEARGQLVAKTAELLGQDCLLGCSELRGPPEGHRAGNILGAGPDAELLAASMDDGLDRLSIAYYQSPDPLRGSDLVSRKGQQSTR